jgi:hypothetical protein
MESYKRSYNLDADYNTPLLETKQITRSLSKLFKAIIGFSLTIAVLVIAMWIYLFIRKDFFTNCNRDASIRYIMAYGIPVVYLLTVPITIGFWWYGYRVYRLMLDTGIYIQRTSTHRTLIRLGGTSLFLCTCFVLRSCTL